MTLIGGPPDNLRMDRHGPTDQELLARAAKAGLVVTVRQLERWHKQHLLPRKVQEHRPGVRGSISCYPPGTESQFLALCRWRQRRRKLHELRFWLWWEGWDIPIGPLRESLLRLLPERPQPSGTDSLDAAEQATVTLLKSPRSNAAAAVRRRLRDPVEVESALINLLVVPFGGLPVWGSHGLQEDLGEKPVERLLLHAMGLERAAIDRVGSVAPWLPAGEAAVPDAIARLVQGGSADIEMLRTSVRDASVSILGQARTYTKLFTEDLPPIAAAVQATYGRDAFGMGSLRPFAEADARSRVLLLAICLRLRTLLGDAPFEALRQTVTAVRPGAEAVLSIVQTDPTLARLFGPDGSRLLTQIPAEERQRIKATVQPVLDAHPTLGGGLDVEHRGGR